MKSNLLIALPQRTQKTQRIIAHFGDCFFAIYALFAVNFRTNLRGWFSHIPWFYLVTKIPDFVISSFQKKAKAHRLSFHRRAGLIQMQKQEDIALEAWIRR